MNKNNKNQGFTMVELIVVIVILGILSATALPKFMDLSGSAREASLAAAKGSMESAKNMFYAKMMAEGNQNSSGAVTINGETYYNYNGHPHVYNGTGLSLGIISLAGISEDDYTLTYSNTTSGSGHDKVVVSLDGSSASTCFASYKQWSGTGKPAEIESDFSDC